MKLTQTLWDTAISSMLWLTPLIILLKDSNRWYWNHFTWRKMWFCRKCRNGLREARYIKLIMGIYVHIIIQDGKIN
jgi:hypothetical protein